MGMVGACDGLRIYQGSRKGQRIGTGVLEHSYRHRIDFPDRLLGAVIDALPILAH